MIHANSLANSHSSVFSLWHDALQQTAEFWSKHWCWAHPDQTFRVYPFIIFCIKLLFFNGTFPFRATRLNTLPHTISTATASLRLTEEFILPLERNVCFLKITDKDEGTNQQMAWFRKISSRGYLRKIAECGKWLNMYNGMKEVCDNECSSA